MTTSFLENNASMANNILSMFSNARQMAFSYIESTVEMLCNSYGTDKFTIRYDSVEPVFSNDGWLLCGFQFTDGEATCILMDGETGEVITPYAEDSDINLEDMVNVLMTISVNLVDSKARVC